MRYLAVYFGENKVRNAIVETTEPQALAEYLDSRQDVGCFPNEIMLFESRVNEAPVLVQRYIRGRDYSERVDSLDGAVQTIKDWIDNLDEPEAIAELLTKVTGAEDVRIIGSGQSAKIAYDIPYKE